MPPLLPDIETPAAPEHECPPFTLSFGYIKSRITPALFETNRRVRFAMNDMVYPHIHLKDISKREKARAWLTQHEAISIREHIDLTVMLMQEFEEIPQDDYCSRGLEYMIDTDEYHERIRRGKEAVMGVQEFLRHGSDDEVQSDAEEMIAAIYNACTCQVTDIARKFGQSDFDAIQL
jgi:hypothetical protein